MVVLLPSKFKLPFTFKLLPIQASFLMYVPPLTTNAPVLGSGTPSVAVISRVLVILTRPVSPVLCKLIFLFAVVVLILKSAAQLISLLDWLPLIFTVYCDEYLFHSDEYSF